MLRIALISVNGTPLLRPLVAEFGEAGGGIGRDERNKLALPDPERRLSRVQALVRFERNCYCLVDQGASPTTVNGIPLSKGSSLRLHDGDFIDAAGFRMRVELSDVSPVAGKVAPAAFSATVIQAFPLAEDPEPWGELAPAIGTLSQPGEEVLAAAVVEEVPLLVDPFDELLAEDYSVQQVSDDVLLEKRFKTVLEAFNPASLERRLRLDTSVTGASNDEDAARLWSLYQRHFPEILADVVQVLCGFKSTETAEPDRHVEVKQDLRAVAGGDLP